MGLSADAWVGGIVTGVANTTYTARNVRPSGAWAATGVIFGVYNLGVGSWALASAVESSVKWGETDSGYRNLMLGFAIPSLAFGVADIAFAIAAQTRARGAGSPTATTVTLTGSGRADAPGVGVALRF